jgi:integral membrane protein
MVDTPIRRLRLVGFLEGMSYLVLLGIAMPLKYLGGMPKAVTIVGTAHGVLFILFFAAMAEVAVRRRPIPPGLGWKGALASILPCGTFVFDAWLKKVEAADRPALDAAAA